MRSDFHTHTRCSPDSETPVDRVIESAVQKGLEAVAITDHAEMDSGRFGFVSPGCRSYSTYKEEVSRAAERFHGKIRVLMGVEIGYRSDFEPQIRYFLAEHRFDMVIGSVHDSPPVNWFDPHAGAILRRKPEMGLEALRLYFTEVERAASSGLFDIIAHIDIYERYFPGLWPNVFEEPSLRPVVEKAVAAIAGHSRMEINLSMFNQRGEFAWSALPFLRIYREMGGRPPAVGSDAHRPACVGLNIGEAEDLARKAGFEEVAAWKDVVAGH